MTTRRTISLPPGLARDIERYARSHRLSFSAAVARLAEESLRKRARRFRSFGAGASGAGDLGERAEQYLRDAASSRPWYEGIEGIEQDPAGS